MAYTGSISENRITIGLQPNVRQALYEEARINGVTVQEQLRFLLRNWYDRRQTTGVQR